MKKLSYKELRNMWLDFYRERGHAVIPSASVVPENDASTLFITAGMQPLVPFLLGEHHPMGKRLCNVQKCIRTNDIESVGDVSHLTFFEMLGNWSFGDYFKREKIAWSWEFLTSKKYLDIDPKLISVTCFEGDNIAPRDTECAQLWESQGVPSDRIYFCSKEHNWWQLPSGVGPCGPDSEMFMDTGAPKCCDDCNPSCSCGKYIEIGNDVYMQFVIRSAGGRAEPASQQNVDTGMGLERLYLTCNGLKSVYDSELFAPAIKIIEELSGKKYSDKDFVKSIRIVAEHTRASTVIIGDGVLPSNTGAGYVLRRLIRRAVRSAKKLGCDARLDVLFTRLINFFATCLGEFYENLRTDEARITEVFCAEVHKFEKTIEQGIKEFEKVSRYVVAGKLPGKTAFRLYDTYGFPIELTLELCEEAGLTVDMTEFEEAKKRHAEKSSAGSVAVFKGGLADQGEQTTRLHTATHILIATLRDMFGVETQQKGANITPERLRFDFNIDHKLDEAEIAEIEKRVNAVIASSAPVTMEEMPISRARQLGALGVFGDKYGDVVKVYTIGDAKKPYSREICGGPHVANVSELGKFKITKQEAVSSGVRRIKAVLE